MSRIGVGIAPGLSLTGIAGATMTPSDDGTDGSGCTTRGTSTVSPFDRRPLERESDAMVVLARDTGMDRAGPDRR